MLTNRCFDIDANIMLTNRKRHSIDFMSETSVAFMSVQIVPFM